MSAIPAAASSTVAGSGVNRFNEMSSEDFMQIIFTELIQKNIGDDQHFEYTAMRLRQIGKELEGLENK